MVWTLIEALRLLDHRLLVRCASRPKVSGICRFDINDSEPFNFRYEFVLVIRTQQPLGLPYMWKTYQWFGVNTVLSKMRKL